jgi:aryl-alcohol dehydrogenase-like predicted oxidoreductase
MIKKRLNTMGLDLSPLAIGCEPLGNMDWGIVDVSECKRAIQKAFVNGINVFDTADVYGLGTSEEELSSALGKERHNTFIISKFGIRWDGDGFTSRAKTYKDSSPNYLVIAIENSLRRLRLEAIPLYFIHWPDEKTYIIDTLEALEKIRKAGKILNYGLSNFPVNIIANVIDKYPIAAIQTPYSLGINNFENHQLFHLALSKGLSNFTYGPLAQGLLSGRYDENSKFKNDDRRHRLEQFSKDRLKRNRHLLVALDVLAKKYNKTITQIAIRWCLDSKYVSSTIVGIKNREQLRENYGALGWSLSINDWKYLEEISYKNSIIV